MGVPTPYTAPPIDADVTFRVPDGLDWMTLTGICIGLDANAQTCAVLVLAPITRGRATRGVRSRVYHLSLAPPTPGTRSCPRIVGWRAPGPHPIPRRPDQIPVLDT